MAAVHSHAQKKEAEAPTKGAILSGMSEGIKDTVVTAMMLREGTARLAAVEKECFADNRRLLKAEIARVQAATEREETLCGRLDEILPKLQDTLDALEGREMTAETIVESVLDPGPNAEFTRM